MMERETGEFEKLPAGARVDETKAGPFIVGEAVAAASIHTIGKYGLTVRMMGSKDTTTHRGVKFRYTHQYFDLDGSRIVTLKAVPEEPTDVLQEILWRVADERKRQISGEGYTLAHDDEHVAGEIADAAAVYAHGGFMMDLAENPIWPWGRLDGVSGHVVKSKSRERQLVIAMALCAAEIERLRRAK